MILPAPQLFRGNRERARLPDGAQHGVVEVEVPGTPLDPLLGDAAVLFDHDPQLHHEFRRVAHQRPGEDPTAPDPLLEPAKIVAQLRGKPNGSLRPPAAARAPRAPERAGGGASIRWATRSPTLRTAARAAASLRRSSTAPRTASDPARASRIFRSRSVSDAASAACRFDGTNSSGAAFAPFPRVAGGGVEAVRSLGAGFRPPWRPALARGLRRFLAEFPAADQVHHGHRLEAQRGPEQGGTTSAAIAKAMWAAAERASMVRSGGGESSVKNGEPVGLSGLYRSSGSVTMPSFSIPEFRTSAMTFTTNPYGTERSARKYT